jgi:DNA polymerase-1
MTSEGVNTSGVYGFMHTLEEAMRVYSPTHIGVAFDPGGPTFRHEAYSEYKAQRAKIPEDIVLSIPLVKRMLEGKGIGMYEVPRYEADDVIGTLSKQAKAQGYEVYILTWDKDYNQLLEDGVYVCHPVGGGEYEKVDLEGMLKKYGLSNTEQFVDMLALMGDASDNIPGCPGVGEKTASRLLGTYGSIDELLRKVGEVKGVLRYKLQQNAETIRFARTLVQINREAPVQFEEELCRRKEGDSAVLRGLYEELEFHGQLKRLPVVTGRPAAEVFRHPAVEVVESEEGIKELVKRLGEGKLVGISMNGEEEKERPEWSSGIGLSSDGEKGYYIPLGGGGGGGLFGKKEGRNRLELLKGLLEDEEIEKTGHDIKGLIGELRNSGIRLGGKVFDTMIGHYLLHPELGHAKGYVLSTELKYSGGGLSGKEAWSGESASLLLRLRGVLWEKMDVKSREVFVGVEMPLVRILSEMELVGVKVNAKRLAESSGTLTSSLKSVEETIYAMSGRRFNINSPRQLSTLLEEHFHLQVGSKTKTGQVSTGEVVLDGLRDKHPVIGKIVEYRQVKKLLSTYVEALPRLINKKTGKIHTSYHQAVASTGRLSSSKPNLQNIPVRTEMGREIRRAFTSDNAGSVFFSADYSQIELRILAHISRDESLQEAFHRGEDIHRSTAMRIYKVSASEVTEEMRRQAKSANFGIIYGISSFGLSRSLNISREESTQLIGNYFESYPGVQKWLEENLEKARKQGYVETLLGRRTQVSNLQSANRAVRAAAERYATNAPIQGSAADVIKVAMIGISRRLQEGGLESRMIMQVHDELNFNVPKSELESVQEIVREEMEGAYGLRVPLVVDCGWGENWLSAH